MLERRKLFPKNIHDISSSDWELGQEMGDAPSSPIAKEEFVLWNKLEKTIKNSYEKWEIDAFYQDYVNELSPHCKLTYAPQAPLYVVEKEVK